MNRPVSNNELAMCEAALPHPTTEELRALSLGQLGEADLSRVAAHLRDCAECCRRIDQMATDDPLLKRLEKAASHAQEPLVPAAQRRSAVRALRKGHDEKTASQQPASELPPVILPAPKQVAEYDILDEVGRGGMGVVYKARHRVLNRFVALKMVLAGDFASASQILRIRLEAELAARVQHPNIVQVYEIGTYEGRPFLALEWVDGGSLADRLDGTPWTPTEAARMIEILARATHAAHEQGVVHRDLKPANVLVGPVYRTGPENTEVPLSKRDLLPSRARSASGTYKITDFGLAQPIEGGKTLTQSGWLVGTPGYMAPEQASGKRALVGPATDIYALGVMLYQLTTGQLPFQGDSSLEVLRAVTEDEAARPRRLQPHIPRDLEAITLHCLEKEPARRYPSALALAEDLCCFQQGKPIHARPVSWLESVRKWARRRPAVAALTLAVLALVLLVTLAAPLVALREAGLRGDADARASDARAAEARATRLAESEGKLRRDALYQVYRARIAAAGAALQNHDVADAARQLAATPEELRGWEWRHLSSRLDDSSAVLATAVPVTATVYSSLEQAAELPGVPAGRQLVPRTERLRLAIVANQSLRILDEQGHTERTLPFPHPEGGGWVVAATPHEVFCLDQVAEGVARVRDETNTVRLRVPVPVGAELSKLAVSPNLQEFAIAWISHSKVSTRVYDSSGKERTRLPDLPGDFLSLVISPGGKELASTSDDGSARLWDLATGQPIAEPLRHPGELKVVSAAFRRDGTRLVTASADGTVCQWDAKTGRGVEPPYERHTGEVWSAVYSPDGQWIASAGTDRTIRLWRATGRQEALVLHGHTGSVNQLAFSGDGRRLVSVSKDTARIWEVDPQASLPVLHGHSHVVYPVAYSPDGLWIASGSWDGTVRLWDALTGELGAVLRHPTFVQALAFGPDGSWLVSAASGDADLCIWDVATARLRRKIPAPGKEGKQLAVSPDGARIAATDWDYEERPHRASVIYTATGQELFSGDGEAFFAYSPDGQWLAGRAADGKTIQLRDARTHALAASFPGHTGQIYWMAFSPDSRLLASVGLDQVVRVWDLSKRECRAELHGHTDDVFAAAFHPEGTRLATAGRDRAIWLWDLATGEEVARLAGHANYVWSLAFSPDGKTLVSGSGDKTVRLWDTEPLRVRHQARRAIEALRPEAARLVDRLFQEKKEASRVVQALKDDKEVSELLRRAAFHALLRRMQANH